MAIDLIIRNEQGQVLLGLRNNEPAKGYYFVPGGRVRKGERLTAAFARILKNETGLAAEIAQAKPLGVYEHIYTNNYLNQPGYGTHCIVLAYEIEMDVGAAVREDSQHREFAWWNIGELLDAATVHDDTKAYFVPRSSDRILTLSEGERSVAS